MKPETNGLADVLKALASIQDELTSLSRRVAELESAAQAQSADPPAHEALSDELVIVLGAAVAAFLGKKARIRRIQPLGSNVWAQQGRVTIQASHALSTARSQP